MSSNLDRSFFFIVQQTYLYYVRHRSTASDYARKKVYVGKKTLWLIPIWEEDVRVRVRVGLANEREDIHIHIRSPMPIFINHTLTMYSRMQKILPIKFYKSLPFITNNRNLFFHKKFSCILCYRTTKRLVHVTRYFGHQVFYSKLRENAYIMF